MTDFQKRCMAAVDRALGLEGLRPTYRAMPSAELEPGASGRLPACVHAAFHIVQNAYEIFIYPDEVVVCTPGQRCVLALRDFGHVDRDLLRTLGEFLQSCLSGHAAGSLPRQARPGGRLEEWSPETETGFELL